MNALFVSELSAHPLPVDTVFAASVNVSGGKVDTAPVAVYVGTNAILSTPVIDAGGQAVNDERTAASIVPAPEPPVCQAEYVLSKAALLTPREAHIPEAERGSEGIKPFSRPSWYDQRGACTVFVVDEFPICALVRAVLQKSYYLHLPSPEEPVLESVYDSPQNHD